MVKNAHFLASCFNRYQTNKIAAFENEIVALIILTYIEKISGDQAMLLIAYGLARISHEEFIL